MSENTRSKKSLFSVPESGGYSVQSNLGDGRFARIMLCAHENQAKSVVRIANAIRTELPKISDSDSVKLASDIVFEVA